MIKRPYALRLLAAMLCLSLALGNVFAGTGFDHLAPPHRQSDEERTAVELLRLSLHKKIFSLPENQSVSDAALLRQAQSALEEISSPANLIGLFDSQSLTVTRKAVHVLLRSGDGGRQAYKFFLDERGITKAEPVDHGIYAASRFKHEMARVHNDLRRILRLENKKKERARSAAIARLKQRLLLLPAYLSEKAVQAFRALIGELRPETMQKLEQWFNNNTAIRASKYIFGGAGWAMPDGRRMNAAEHNAQLFRVLEDLWQGDAEAFRARHVTAITDAEWPAYKKAIFDEGFQKDAHAVASDPELLEILALAVPLHDYGKLLRGSDHPKDSAELAAALLQRLGYDAQSKKYRWTMALIELHTQLGAGFLLGESTPQILLNAMQRWGVQDVQDREQFMQLLSLLTFADIGAVGKGRFTVEKLRQLRAVQDWMAHHPQDVVAQWPRMRLLALMGRPLFPEGPHVGDGEMLRAHIQRESLRPEAAPLIQRAEERRQELSGLLQNMEFMYARYLFGPSDDGRPAHVSAGNTVKFMTLAAGLCNALGKSVRMISFSDDSHGAAFQTVLSDAGFTQIQAMLSHREAEIVAALREGKTVRLWGIPVKLAQDGEVLRVDARNIRAHFDRMSPVEIGKIKLKFEPDMNEKVRLAKHLEWVRESGYIRPDDVIRNEHYDSLGLLKIERLIPGSGRYLTLRLSNSKLFDLDVPDDAGGLASLPRLFDEYRPLHGPSPFDPEAKAAWERQNTAREQMRIFIARRAGAFREKGWKMNAGLKSYLNPQHPSYETSPEVRKEIQQAIHMLEGMTPDGKERLNIGWITYEMDGLMQKGGLAAVAGSAPAVLHNRNGHNAYVVMPGWSKIFEETKSLPEGHPRKPKYVLSTPGPDGGMLEIYSLQRDGMPIYLIRHEKFNPLGVYDVQGRKIEIKKSDDIYRSELDAAFARLHPNCIHPVNAETAIFFSKASLIALSALQEQGAIQKPDILHTHDWQTGLVPSLIRSSNEFQSKKYKRLFRETKLVQTIHNLGYKGQMHADPDSEDEEARRLWNSMGLPADAYHAVDGMGLEFFGTASLMKAGITDADAVTTVDKHYAEEVKTELFGQKFEGIFNALRRFLGILNGISRRVWNPREDRNLVARYEAHPTAQDRRLGVSDLPEGKRVNKAWVKAKYGLDQRVGERIPLITFVGRMDQMKGLHLLLPVVEQLLKERKAQFAFSGEGDEKFLERLAQLKQMYPQDITLGRLTDEELRQVIAASDMGVIPSISEPFGLVSPQFLRFGTVPIANAVGGLQTTVKDFGQDPESGNGYLVELRRLSPDLSEDYLSERPLLTKALIESLRKGMERAIDDYQDVDNWNAKAKQAQALSEQYSWDGPADRYEALYRELLGRHRGPSRVLDEARAFEKSALAPSTSLDGLESSFFQREIQKIVDDYTAKAPAGTVTPGALYAHLRGVFAAQIKEGGMNVFVYPPSHMVWVRRGPYAYVLDPGRKNIGWKVRVSGTAPLVLGDVANRRMVKEMAALLPLSLRMQYPLAEIPLDELFPWLDKVGLDHRRAVQLLSLPTLKPLPLTPQIHARLQQERVIVHHRVVKIIQTLQILADLAGALRDHDEQVRLAGIAGLGRSREILPWLPVAWKMHIVSELMGALNNMEPEIVQRAARALDLLVPVVETLPESDQGEIIEKLVDNLESTRPATVKNSLKVLAAMRALIRRYSRSAEIHRLLQSTLDGAPASLRPDLLRTISKIRSKPSEEEMSWETFPAAAIPAEKPPLADASRPAMIKPLIEQALKALSAEDWESRKQAADSLGSNAKAVRAMGAGGEEEVVRGLLHACQDEEALVRAASLAALGQYLHTAMEGIAYYTGKETAFARASLQREDFDGLLKRFIPVSVSGGAVQESYFYALKLVDYFLHERMDLETLWRFVKSDKRERLFAWIAAAQDTNVNEKMWLGMGENPAMLIEILRSEVSQDPLIRAYDISTRWSQLESKLHRAHMSPITMELLFPHVTITLSYLRNEVGNQTGFARLGGLEPAAFERIPFIERLIGHIYNGRLARSDMRSAKRMVRALGPPADEVINYLRQLSLQIADAARGKDHPTGLIDVVQRKFHHAQKTEDLDAMQAYRDYVQSGHVLSPETRAVFQKLKYMPTEADTVPPERKEEVIRLLDAWISVYKFGVDLSEQVPTAGQDKREAENDKFLKDVKHYQGRRVAEMGRRGSNLDTSFLSSAAPVDRLEGLTKIRRALQRDIKYQSGELFLETVRMDNAVDFQLWRTVASLHSLEERGLLPLATSIRMLRLLVENARLTGRPAREFLGLEEELDALAADERLGQDRMWWLRFHGIMERIERQIDTITQDSVDRYQRMAESLTDQIDVKEDKRRWVENYTIDRLKGESLYQLSLAVDTLGEEIRKQTGKSRWHVIVRGTSAGRIRLIRDVEDLRESPVKPDEIAVVPSLPLDAPQIKEAAGVLSFEATPLLGHASYQARDRANPIPYASTTNKKTKEMLEKLNGRWVELHVEQGDVSVRRIPEPLRGIKRLPPTVKEQDAPVVLGPANLTDDKAMFSLSEYAYDQVGAKAMRLVEMQQSGIGVQVPGHFPIPFAVYEKVLNDPINAGLAQDIKSRIDKVTSVNFSGNFKKELEEIRTRITRLEIPDSVLKKIHTRMKYTFRQKPVFVRSSSNAEDLDGYSGAGLYDSYGGIVSRHELEGAMLKVWASVWNERAFMDRQNKGVGHQKVKMALLVQEMAPVDYSFVINTVDPVRGNPDIAVMEMVQGYGEALVSGDPRFRGQPYRILYNRKTGEIKVDSLADISERIVADASGRLQYAPTDYLHDSFLRREGDLEHLKRIFEAALKIEALFGAPQEIEGAMSLQENNWDVQVVQSRRQVIEKQAEFAAKPLSEPQSIQASL